MQRSLPPLALAFCAGAALRLHLPVPIPLAMAVVATLAAALLLARVGPRASLCLAVGLAAGAGILVTAAWSRLPANSAANLTDRRWVRLHGVVAGAPGATGWGISFDLDTERAETRREPLAVSGKVRVYATEEMAGDVEYGRRVAVEGRVTLPDDAAKEATAAQP